MQGCHAIFATVRRKKVDRLKFLTLANHCCI